MNIIRIIFLVVGIFTLIMSLLNITSFIYIKHYMHPSEDDYEVFVKESKELGGKDDYFTFISADNVIEIFEKEKFILSKDDKDVICKSDNISISRYHIIIDGQYWIPDNVEELSKVNSYIINNIQL